jgi:hypothetical protein
MPGYILFRLCWLGDIAHYLKNNIKEAEGVRIRVLEEKNQGFAD